MKMFSSLDLSSLVRSSMEFGDCYIVWKLWDENTHLSWKSFEWNWRLQKIQIGKNRTLEGSSIENIVESCLKFRCNWEEKEGEKDDKKLFNVYSMNFESSIGWYKQHWTHKLSIEILSNVQCFMKKGRRIGKESDEKKRRPARSKELSRDKVQVLCYHSEIIEFKDNPPHSRFPPDFLETQTRFFSDLNCSKLQTFLEINRTDVMRYRRKHFELIKN